MTYRKALAELHSGAPRIITKGKLPDSHIVFLDEIFKASDGILNALLTALNERRYTNEGKTIHIPTISFFSASNEIPNFANPEEKILKPLYDRFELKVVTEYVEDRDARLTILKQKQAAQGTAQNPSAVISLAELQAMQDEVLQVRVPDQVNELMDDVLCELRGKGISYCATCDGGFFKDKVAVVVGGGNTAVEDAMYLANICTEVHLVHRRDTLRADAIYAKPLDELKNVTKHMSAAVDGVREEDGRVAGVLIRDLATGEVTDLDASALFVAVGSLPKSDILRDTGIELDERGYVVAGEDGKTSIPGVFAAGDVRTKQLRQVATAVGDGANAAASAFEFLSFE